MASDTTYVTPSAIRSLGWFLTLIGVAAAIVGPVYAINGATQAGGAVEVPVELTADGRTAATLAGLPEGARLLPFDGGVPLQLSAWDSTVLEQLLARGDAALFGLAFGVGVWLLRPVLDSVAAGRAFGAGNARRLAGLAAVVVVAGGVGPLLPQIASLAVLDRLDLVGPDSPFVMGVTFAFLPVVLAGALLLVLAQAFRQGELISRDIEGLV